MKQEWVCDECGFSNKPHALRRGGQNDSCEQCGHINEQLRAARAKETK